MKRRPRQVLCFITLFLFSSSILLYGVTKYREKSYDNLVRSWHLPEEMRHEGIEGKKEYQRQWLRDFHAETPLDEIYHDPLMIEYAAEVHADGVIYEHDIRFGLVPEICEREPSVFPLRFFHVYGKLCSFENLQHAVLMGFATANDLGPFTHTNGVFNDMGEAIYAWELKGNTREGEWMDAFLASPEYEAFLQHLYASIEPHEGKSLEEMMEEVREASTESYNPLSELKTPFFKDVQSLATVVYESYQKDKEQGDISRVTYEAEILHRLHERVVWIEGLTPCECMDLHWITSSPPDPFVDLAGILACSIAFSLGATLLVSKRYWK